MTYAKIHQDSPDTASSALDLFATPETKTSALSSSTIEINPTRDPGNTQVDFCVETTKFNYLDLANTRIHVQCKVLKEDGTKLSDDVDSVKVMPISNFFGALFSIVQISLGNHDIQYNSNYSLTSYMENLLSYGLGCKKTIMQSSLWIEDDTGPVDTADITEAMAADIKKRIALIAGSKTIDMIGKLNSSFMNQDRLLPPGVPLRIRLTLNDPSFLLQHTVVDQNTKYKVVIDKCSLIAPQIEVHPSIVAAHNAYLTAGHTMKFVLNKVDTQMFSIAAGQQNARISVSINQQKPKRAFFAFVSHEARSGSYITNPYNFKHFNLSSAVLDVDGQPRPSKPILVNFGENMYTQLFYNLAAVTGKGGSDEDNGITRDKFAKGYTILAFDLTPDQCEGGGVHLIENSSITLDLTFRDALTTTIGVFCYLERDDLLEIDQQRVVHRLSRAS